MGTDPQGVFMNKLVIMAVVFLASTVSFGADKIFMVDGKQVTPQVAVTAGMAHKKVQRCTELAAGTQMLVDGKMVSKGYKCAEVALYIAKSGLPTWKASSTGDKW
jgi:hypothetical protein